MEQQKSKIVDLSSHLKKKIYNEFNAMLYKEFNQTVFDINYIFGYEEEHLFEVLEEAFDEGGPIKMRKEIDYTIQSFKLDFNKNNII
tara:strand:- start:203 stop:463 length:261 start_codon:yes stop_codon:yes gene_type:complete